MISPEIIIGPPGTGKTTSLLNIVEQELTDGVAPSAIGFVSFTRKACQEAQVRAKDKFGLSPKQLPHFRTLHSACFRGLNLTRSDVFEHQQLREFADWAGLRVTFRRQALEEGSSIGQLPGDRALHMERISRQRCIPLRQQYDLGDDDLPWVEVERVAAALKEFKKKRELVDYTDMLGNYVASDFYRPPELDVLVVDESQDLSRLQWQVVRKLSTHVRKLVVAGDDDQAIYGWAGADVEEFVQMLGNVRTLARSYRVPAAVQRLAAQVLEGVALRRPKVWAARDEEGAITRYPVLEDVDFSGEDVLVLARNEYIIRTQVEPHLRRMGIIYERGGVPSLQPSLISAIRFWEALRRGEIVTVDAARRVYEYMTTGKQVLKGFKELPGLKDDQPVTLTFLKEQGGLLTEAPWFEALERVSPDDREYILAARRNGEQLNKPRVRVSTIHSAKGGEAAHVVLMTEIAARTAQEMLVKPDDEARVWYVAVTRAKNQLSIVDTRERNHFSL